MKNAILLALSVIFSLTGVLQANPADIYPTGKVDMVDFAVFAAAWLSNNSLTANWNPNCDISEPPDGVIDELDLAVLTANLWWTALDDMVWVSISEAGFTGYMSKYETTNAQYCEFLNSALASSDIAVSSNRVYGANGSNGGADFVGEIYFDTYAADSDSQITYSGGVFSVRSRDGYYMGNHPVVEVSWNGATAFCNYYGYRLPTEWEWQAVADHTVADPYIYGCGTTIDHSKANYGFYNPLGLSSYPYTSPVNHYSPYGYGMNDMAGNVVEWTSSLWDPAYSSRVFRGGNWGNIDGNCTVSYRDSGGPHGTYGGVGFRVCR